MAVTAFLGRILMSVIFILSGLHKIFGFTGTVLQMTNHLIPAATFLAICAIIIELGGGLCILLGYRVRVVGIVLVLFLIPTTAIFHTGLAVAQPFDITNVLKNLAIMGGLLILSGRGAGEISLDSED